MANHIVTEDVINSQFGLNDLFELNNGEYLFLKTGVLIATDDSNTHGILLDGNNQVTVAGDIYTGSYAIYSKLATASNVTINIKDTGSVGSADGLAIYTIGGGTTISNNGFISSSIFLTGDDNHIFNSGHITSSGYAIINYGDALQAFELVNSGEIIASSSFYALDLAAENDTIVNTGTISGVVSLVD